MRKWVTVLFIVFLLLAVASVLLMTWIRYRPLATPTIKQNFTAISVDPEDPSVGLRNAPVTIVTFSSFTCPACKRNADVVRQMVAQYPDKVRLVWKDLPADDAARQLALAARCAQGQGKFWQYHDQLFLRQDQITNIPASLVQIARNLGMNEEVFTQCLSDQQPLDLIERTISQATAAGITAVPYSEVNGTIRVDGELSFSEWQTIINKL